MNSINTIINKFLKNHIDKNTLGVLVYGSYVLKSNDELSDIDLMIIQNDYDTSDIGSEIIDGFRIEYFIQDIKTILKQCKKEIENDDPSHLTKYATCKILFDKDGSVHDLISTVTSLYNQTIKQRHDDNTNFKIFSIKNRLDDLKTQIDSDCFYSIYYVVLEKIRELYSEINGFISLPLTKTEKLYKDDNYFRKYIGSQFHSMPEMEFRDKYLSCLSVEDRDTMFNKLVDIYNYSFSRENINPNNFVLRFKNNPPFKV